MAIAATKLDIKVSLFLGLGFLCCLVQGARRGLADSGSTVFDVTEYGAKADGKTDNVEKIMQTWIAACKSSGAAEVVVPQGEFLIGPAVFQGPCTGPITFQVEGTLKATTDISEYSSPDWLAFEHVSDLTVTGGGTFDGQGSAVWQFNDCHKNAKCQMLPFSIKFNKVNNSAIHNITSINSKAFHMFIYGSNNFAFHNLNLTAPANSPNTDGIHISTSSYVNITNTYIGTGDDCISIGQGSTNVHISGVTCGPGHGISVGSLGKYNNEKDVSDIVVQNCTLSGTTNGLRIKTYAGSQPSLASSITFQDIILDHVKNPIIIDQKYGSRQITEGSRVKISDVLYKNIKGTSTSYVAAAFMCSSSVPCEGIKMVDVDLVFQGMSIKKGASFSSSCSNAKLKVGGKLNPPAPICL